MMVSRFDAAEFHFRPSRLQEQSDFANSAWPGIVIRGTGYMWKTGTRRYTGY